MTDNRLQQLQKFYDEDPADPFNIYGLALEYLKSDLKKSRQLFEKLLSEHPEYLPTYYHAARLFEALNEKELASKVYLSGMNLAKIKSDNKTFNELQSAYQELMFE